MAIISQPLGPCCFFLTSKILHLESYSPGADAIGNTWKAGKRRALSEVLRDKPA